MDGGNHTCSGAGDVKEVGLPEPLVHVSSQAVAITFAGRVAGMWRRCWAKNSPASTSSAASPTEATAQTTATSTWR